MSASEELLLRQYEKVLDEHHKTFAIWNDPRHEALFAVMAFQDFLFFARTLGPTPPLVTVGSAQTAKRLEEGASQAIRWLTSDHFTSVQGTESEDVMQHAYEYCAFASEYITIADFHMMYSRQWATASASDQTKTITFDPVEGPGQSTIMASHEQVREQSNRGMDLALSISPADIERLHAYAARVSHKLSNGHIHIDAMTSDCIKVVAPWIRGMRLMERIPLDPAVDMSGFTMSDYWIFMEAITGWSAVAYMKYTHFARLGVPQNKCMPTQIVNEPHFVKQIVGMSGLNVQVVQNILDRLAYRPARKSDILLTPFLRCNNTVCWSPSAIIKYRHERNLLKVMVRGPIDLKRHADTVNGRRDRLLGRRVGEHFSKAGYQFQLDTEIRGDGDQTDVDVILYQSRRPNEVLIVEAKAVIAPDEISEVFDATKTIQGAQGQLQRAISIIRSMAPRELRERFKFIDWDLVRDLRGIVITSDAEAYSTVDQRQFPSITYEMLLYRFRSSHFKSPVHFWRAAIERPWQKGEVVAGQDIVHRDVLIGEITYRLPACSVEVDMDRNGIGKLDRVVQIHAK